MFKSTPQINFLDRAISVEFPPSQLSREQFQENVDAFNAAMKICVQTDVPLNKEALRRTWDFVTPIGEVFDALPFTWTSMFHNRWDDNMLMKHWIATICVTPTPAKFAALKNTFAGKSRTLEQAVYAAVMRCAHYIQNHRDEVTPPDDTPIAA